MTKTLTLAGLALGAALALPAAPAPAQPSAGNERVVIVFGNDPCPTNSSGDEYVVCVRRDENERYRIPQELRTPLASPENESWASRARSFEYVGRTGTMSCSPVGPGGSAGCVEQLNRQWREERRLNANNPTPAP